MRTVVLGAGTTGTVQVMLYIIMCVTSRIRAAGMIYMRKKILQHLYYKVRSTICSSGVIYCRHLML